MASNGSVSKGRCTLRVNQIFPAASSLGASPRRGGGSGRFHKTARVCLGGVIGLITAATRFPMKS